MTKSIKAIHPQPFPHVVEVIITVDELVTAIKQSIHESPRTGGVMRSYEIAAERFVEWCQQNCKAAFTGPSVPDHIRPSGLQMAFEFEREDDAALFRLFHG